MKMIPFSFENHAVRVSDRDGAMWFVAKDVCAALTKHWNGQSLDQIPDDWKGMTKLVIPGAGEQDVAVINEAAVYKLAFRSNKPEAERFTNWVASDVLPTIRKTGGYGEIDYKKIGRQTAAIIEDKINAALAPLEEKIEGLESEIDGLREENTILSRRASGFSSSRDYKLAITVADEHRIPVKGRGRLVHTMKASLSKFTAERHYPKPRDEQRDDGKKARPMFHVDAIAAWLVAEGYAMIAAHLARRPFARRPDAQCVLKLVQPKTGGRA